MEVTDLEQLGLALSQPFACRRALTLRAASIATAVKADYLLRAALAARDMAAQRRGAAAFDRRHHLQLPEADMAGIGTAPGGTVFAEDIRDFQPEASHRCRRLSRRLLPPRLLGSLRLGRLAGEFVDRARHRGDDAVATRV